MYRALILVSAVFLSSCSWWDGEEEEPLRDNRTPEEKAEEKTKREKAIKDSFKEVNEQVFSKDVSAERADYLRGMGQSQGNEQHAKLEELQDFTKARGKITKEQFDFLMKEAGLGDTDAMYDLGIVFKYGFYDNGADLERARAWFLKASKQGHLQAHRQLHYLKLHY